LPPLPAWRYELQQRVDAYRARRQRPAPARVLAFRPAAEPEAAPAAPATPPRARAQAAPARRSADLGPWGPQVGASTSGTRAAGALGPAPTNWSAPLAARRPEPLAEPLAEPMLAPPRARPLEPPLPAPNPVWDALPAAAPAAVQVPELAPVATLAEEVARPAPRRHGAMALAWPAAARHPEPATFLQLPLPMWAPAPVATTAACPVAPLRLRLRAAAADAAIIAVAALLFALAGWASLGAPAPDAQSWRPLLPALVAVPGVLAALYLLACAYVGGATVGMRWFGLHVVGWDGQPAPAAQLRRGWASVISLAALGLGYFWVFCDSQQLPWHDYIARTCVAAIRPARMDQSPEPPA